MFLVESILLSCSQVLQYSRKHKLERLSQSNQRKKFSLVLRTVQLRDKRPTHTQNARTISAYTRRVRMRATLVRLFLCYSQPLIFFVCRCLANQTTNDLLFSNRNEYLFFCQNVHMPLVLDGSMKLTANEILYNLYSPILESWLRIDHPCST